MIVSPAELVRNPAAPSSLFDGGVDGARPFPGSTYFHDNSGRGNHGTLTNYANPAEGWVWVPELGRWGNSSSATGNHIILTRAPAVAGNSWTYSCWLNLAGGYYPWRGTSHSALDGILISGVRLYLYREDYGSFQWRIDTLFGGTITGLHHWVVSWSGNAVEMWYNGRSGGAQDASGRSFTPSNLVAWNPADAQSAIIDPLIYPRALDPAEIAWLANQANRLYVPDTRRVFVPTSAPAPTFQPAWARRRQQTIGSGVI